MMMLAVTQALTHTALEQMLCDHGDFLQDGVNERRPCYRISPVMGEVLGLGANTLMAVLVRKERWLYIVSKDG